MPTINTILSELTASISELKKNPMALISQTKGRTVAILNRNKPVFYLVPAEKYEQLLAQKAQLKE